MLQGIHLSLMIGPLAPVPAPQSVMDALVTAKVTSSTTRSGFQLTFAVSKRSPLLTTMLPSGYFDPMVTRVILIVTMGGVPNVIMDGIVTNHELSPSSEPGQSTLTITGSDLSVLMNVIEIVRPFPAMGDFLQVLAVLAPYAAFGVTPVVIPPLFTSFMPPTEQIDSQNGTDLDHIQKLASQNGYVFYVEPGPLPGQSIAYFGPNIRIPVPQPALNINMDGETNVESLSVSLDGLAKTILIVTIMDPITGKIPIPLPIPDFNIFQPPLGLRPTPPAKVTFARDMADKKPIDVVKRIVGRLIKDSTHAITVSGSLDVVRYGHVLRSRMLVGVRGAGVAYDGLYFVDSVTHDLKRGEYKQSFQLSRDGLISATPKVPV
jgi:hypothetical protein